MSFADSVREELLGVTVRKPCCRRSVAYGLLIDAEIQAGQITAVFRSRAVAEYASALFAKQFGKFPQVRNESAHGHALFRLFLTSGQAPKWLDTLSEYGVDDVCTKISGHSEQTPDEIVGLGCENCSSAFLRGVFLATGTVSDPHSATHLEFLLRQPARVSFLTDFLTFRGYVPGTVRRGESIGLYFKNGNAVDELISMTGAIRSAMDMMNVRIERDIRNQENRATNCVAKNIEKSVSAISRQMAAIEKLTLTGMLAQLPEPLRLTARLRAENPDASLEELRKLHEPPITKSGLNHRLKKLLEAAEK